MKTDARQSPPWVLALRSVWQQRSLRERRLLLAGAVLLGGLLLWQWGLAPAWSVWREAPMRQAEIDLRTRQMLQLQAEAQSLQAPVRIGRQQALEQLKASADKLLGPGAQIQPQGDQLQVSLRGTPAADLAQWLALAREQAQALPLQAQLQRQQTTTPDQPEGLWQGSLLLRLP